MSSDSNCLLWILFRVIRLKGQKTNTHHCLCFPFLFVKNVETYPSFSSTLCWSITWNSCKKKTLRLMDVLWTNVKKFNRHEYLCKEPCQLDSHVNVMCTFESPIHLVGTNRSWPLMICGGEPPWSLHGGGQEVTSSRLTRKEGRQEAVKIKACGCFWIPGGGDPVWKTFQAFLHVPFSLLGPDWELKWTDLEY